MPDINRLSLECLLVRHAYSANSYGNIKFYLHPHCQEKILGRKTRPGVNGIKPGSKTNSSIEYLLLVEILEDYTELIFHYKFFSIFLMV